MFHRQRWHQSTSRKGIIIHQTTGGTLGRASSRVILISTSIPADQLHYEQLSPAETADIFHRKRFQLGHTSRIKNYCRVPGKTSDSAERVKTCDNETRCEQQPRSEDLKLAGDQEEAEPTTFPSRWLRRAVQASSNPKVVAAISRKEKALLIEDDDDQWLGVNHSFLNDEDARNCLDISATWF